MTSDLPDRIGPYETVNGPIPFRTIYERLRTGVGEIEPWPARSPFEYVCGAILVQNTAWGNLLRSLASLREATAFEPARLLALGDEELTALIRVSGFMRAKSRALRAYAEWSQGSRAVAAPGLDDDALRGELLGLPGIGPETADVVALMVFDRSRFVFDAHGRRMLRQAGYTVGRQYEAARRAHEAAVAAGGFDVEELKDSHGLVLEAGKRARAAGGWETYGPTIGIAPVRR